MSQICINAYEIEGTECMAWPVRRYTVRRRDGVELRQEDHRRLKDAAFGLRRDYRAQCAGYGFIIDVDERTLVVPKSWVFPSGVERDGLIFALTDEFDVRPVEPGHDVIVAEFCARRSSATLKIVVLSTSVASGKTSGVFVRCPDWDRMIGSRIAGGLRCSQKGWQINAGSSRSR